MATVVDSLVIQLGFDTRQFSGAARQAIAGLEQVKKGAAQTGETLRRTEDQGRKTAQQMSSQGNVAAEYFNKIRNGALSVMAVMIGGHGLTEVVSNTVTRLASMGRQAQMIGTSVPQLAAFRNMIEAAGGSAEEAGASMQRIQNSLNQLRYMGHSQHDQFFRAIGGVPKDAADALIQFARFAERHRNQPGLTQMVGQMGGYGTAEITLAMKGEAAVRRELAEAQKRTSGSTQEAAEQQERVQKAWIALKTSASNLADILITKFGPALTKIFDAVTKFVQDHPNIATAIGVGLGASGLGLGLFGMFKSFFGGFGGAAGGAALTASSVALDGSAAALMGAAAALTAAAAALGGGSVANAAGNVAGTLAGGAGGRAGRYATSSAARGAARRGLTRVIAGRLMRFVPLVGWVAAEAIDSASTATDDTTMAPNTGGIRGGDPASLGLSDEQYDVFRNTLAKRESGGRYGIMGGSSGRFAGKYQMGRAEIEETARALGETPPTTQQFLHDPAMQERYFLRYTLGHHQQLMRDPRYAAMSPTERAGTLATAHLMGVGGALKQLHGGSAGSDAFNTSGASYDRMIRNAFQAQQVAQGGTAGRQQISNDNSRTQTVHVNGPITVQTAATDAAGVARGLRREFANQANTGLA